MMSIINSIRNIPKNNQEFMQWLEDLKFLSAKNLIHNLKRDIQNISNIQDAEFKVFSQFGDDGIIQYLINILNITNEEKSFIEFGVEDYTESNTRFLLMNDLWRGLVIDGSNQNIENINKSNYFWKYELTAKCEFITSENINSLFKNNGFTEKIGLLSIDIDGNDYWIWKEIEVIDPVIVIVEYNSVFGKNYPVTIPYKKDFYRTKAHYSNLYWGASLMALQILADSKGYTLIGSNSAGNNAYFVKNDRIGKLVSLTVDKAYVNSKYRESIDSNGNLTFISGNERIKVIKDCDVYNISDNMIYKIKDLYSLTD